MSRNRLRRLCLLVVILWHPLLHGDDNQPLHNALKNCIDSRFIEEQATPINDVIFLAEDCPALDSQRTQNTWLQRLQPPLDSNTSLNQLLDIRLLLQQQRQLLNRSSKTIDRDYLQDLRDELEFESSQQEISLWQQFLNWLKERYKDDDEENNDLQWWLDILSGKSIPDWLGNVLFYTSVAILIALAALIVFNEIRALRRPGARRRRLQRSQGGDWADDLPVLHTLDWQQVRSLPAAQQPGAILRYIIDHFIERGWLSENRSRTNREMWRELRSNHADVATAFASAVNLTEQAIYGDQSLDERQLLELYDTAQNLAGKDQSR